MMSVNRLPTNQAWFINKRQQLGYLCDEKGECFGVALEGMAAFLADEMHTFSNRYKILNDTPIESIADEVKKVRDQAIKWSTTATNELQGKFNRRWKDIESKLKNEYQEQKILNQLLDQATRKVQRARFDEIQEHIAKQKEKYFKQKPQERLHFEALSEFEASAQTVEVHHQPQAYSHLFELKFTIHQNASRTLPLMISKKLEDQDGIIRAEVFSGIYSNKELVTYFSSLRSAIEAHLPPLTHPLALVLAGGRHAITVGYHPRTKKWTLINANQLPQIEIKDPLMDIHIAQAVMRAFQATQDNNSIAFSSHIFVLKKQEEQEKVLKQQDKNYKSFHTAWKETGEWKTIHVITKDKINKQDNRGASWLYCAARDGSLETTHLLLNEKANFDLQCNGGATPLFMAAQNSHLEIVKALLAKGANPNLACDDGVTPLFMAAQNGHLEIVKALLAQGANPHLASADGVTPLFIAAQNGHLEIVEELLKNKAEPNLACADGSTPLYVAAQNNHLEIVEELLKNKAEPNLAFTDGSTPLCIAAQNGHLEIVKALLANGANPHLARTDGSTPLYIAAQSGHAKIVQRLLLENIDIDQDIQGSTKIIIDIANTKGRKGKIEALLRKHNNHKLPDTLSGFTPLHAAVFFGHVEVVQALLDKGADTTKTTLGISAMNLAIAMNHQPIVKLLTSHNKKVKKNGSCLGFFCKTTRNKAQQILSDDKKLERKYNA